MLKSYGWGGGPCDFSVSPSPFGLDFGTLDSDFGLDQIKNRSSTFFTLCRFNFHFLPLLVPLFAIVGPTLC